MCFVTFLFLFLCKSKQSKDVEGEGVVCPRCTKTRQNRILLFFLSLHCARQAITCRPAHASPWHALELAGSRRDTSTPGIVPWKLLVGQVLKRGKRHRRETPSCYREQRGRARGGHPADSLVCVFKGSCELELHVSSAKKAQAKSKVCAFQKVSFLLLFLLVA